MRGQFCRGTRPGVLPRGPRGRFCRRCGLGYFRMRSALTVHGLLHHADCPVITTFRCRKRAGRKGPRPGLTVLFLQYGLTGPGRLTSRHLRDWRRTAPWRMISVLTAVRLPERWSITQQGSDQLPPCLSRRPAALTCGRPLLRPSMPRTDERGEKPGGRHGTDTMRRAALRNWAGRMHAWRRYNARFLLSGRADQPALRCRHPRPPGFATTADAYWNCSAPATLRRLSRGTPTGCTRAPRPTRSGRPSVRSSPSARPLLPEPPLRTPCSRRTRGWRRSPDAESPDVAVCSSATSAEDLPEASFAGQQETPL